MKRGRTLADAHWQTSLQPSRLANRPCCCTCGWCACVRQYRQADPGNRGVRHVAVAPALLPHLLAGSTAIHIRLAQAPGGQVPLPRRCSRRWPPPGSLSFSASCRACAVAAMRARVLVTRARVLVTRGLQGLLNWRGRATTRRMLLRRSRPLR